MKIPFFDLNRQYKEIAEIIEDAAIDVMRSTQYIEGETVKRLEEELAEYLDVKYVITCNSGTDAIRIALQAAGVGYGDEVITTPFTFYATAEAIAQVGAVPVFCDILEKSLNIDVSKIEEKITVKTKAILPVHIFGMPADMDNIIRIATTHNLYVIEDACQAIGAEYKKKKTGTIGDVGCFSFYPTKNLGAFGDGGMITSNDEKIAVCARALKSHGAGKEAALAREYIFGGQCDELDMVNDSDDPLYDPYKYYNYLIGGNSRLDSIQAAVLLTKLSILNDKNSRRSEIACIYRDGLKNTPVIISQKEDDIHKSCWHQFGILVDDKKAFFKFMTEKGIGIGEFYPVPLHLQKVFRHLGYRKGDLPISEKICDRSVCLPIFPELLDEEVQFIIDTIHEFYK
ncbi:DegT/DnrJ/EryC1/StrS family aminotransferase [Butyrivibrio fibrisolvens]|uniref:DegT/DnrJ/EryC1/StrS family aminotransferase n=1 Tax=Butyrivibrio fibrisolvens TaxID=831 RepID=UPI0004298098|nr:DegT/DnrJ/EryC1/StrS family aminotransferase [Butyrivibrio fibrisolvens]